MQQPPRMFSVAAGPCIIGFFSDPMFIDDPHAFKFERVFIVGQVRGEAASCGLIEGPMSTLNGLNCEFNCGASVPHFYVEQR